MEVFYSQLFLSCVSHDIIGIVYVFKQVSSFTWTYSYRIVSSDVNTSDSFGVSLCWYGSQIYIGDSGGLDDSGMGLNENIF